MLLKFIDKNQKQVVLTPEREEHKIKNTRQYTITKNNLTTYQQQEMTEKRGEEERSKFVTVQTSRLRQMCHTKNTQTSVKGARDLN